jgi:uncharacterized protein (TIGR03086 family)
MSIEKSVLVPLDADQTFALITEPERMRRWFALTTRMDLRAGGDYRWTVVPGGHAIGTVTEVEPGKRMVFTFGWEGNEGVPPGSTNLIITLEPADGGTTVRLVHEGLPADQEADHLTGWTHFLDRLALVGRKGDAGFDNFVNPDRQLDLLTAAEASLALCQWSLRDLSENDGKAQTPCSKFTVDQLIEHLMGSIVFLAAAIGVTITPSQSGTYESRIADAAQPLLEGWRNHGTEGMVKLGDNELPAEVAVRIIIMELLVHAWDFAHATGRTLPEDDVLAVYALEQAQALVRPEMRDGDRFAAEIFVGPDADAFTKLAAFTGRAA